MLKLIHTSCEKCCFAEWSNNEQTGCYAGRLTKYQGSDSAIGVEKDNLKYYVINNKICNMYCNENNTTIDEKLQEQKIRIIPKIDYYVIIDNSDKNNLYRSLESIGMQVNKPLTIKLCNISYLSNLQPSELIKLCREKLSNVDWEVINYDSEVPLDDIEYFIKPRKCQGQYITTLHSGYILPRNLVDKLDYITNYQLEGIIILMPDDESHNGLTIQRKAMLYCGTIEQIFQRADFDEQNHLIKTFSEVDL